MKRPCILLAMAAAGAVATPVLAQTPPPDVRSPGGVRSGVPDFSGIWRHPGLGFGPPLTGPGPVRNKVRLPSGASNYMLLVGDDTNPILKPAAAEVVRKRGEISLSGRIFPDPDNMCMQNPVPYLFWNFNVQILQQPDKVTFIYQHDDDFRVARLNGSHPVPVTPSVHGDAIGHYEGDVLVVDTVGVKVGPHRMIDRLGTPYTDALHVVERYRLLDYDATRQALERQDKEWPRSDGIDPNFRGNGLQLEFTVEDPGVFTMPWSATVTYGRNVSQWWDERVCAENVEHDYQYSYFSDKQAHLPTADRPDF